MDDIYCYTDEDLADAYQKLEAEGIQREGIGVQRYKGLRRNES